MDEAGRQPRWDCKAMPHAVRGPLEDRAGSFHGWLCSLEGLGLLLALSEWAGSCMVVCVAQGRVSNKVLAHWWVGGSPTVMR